ncbi:MAG TPA: FtsH protease activity modulator HflK [Micropepsaceae bacterium]|jgi:membrane protease subunit HflK|nr:FtsH protease activity modulator HflK [Micropepsaceae bacterium]
MPWNNQTGGGRPGGGGRGPWGTGPSGGGTPPDLEEFLKRSQEKIRQALPKGFGGGGALIVGLIVVAVWLMSGIYVVDPDEQGVVTRFGAFVGRTTPGINYHLPWPIESVATPPVTRENQLNIGYRVGNSEGARDIPEESLMLTGDENIIDTNFTVFWVIKDAAAFLFNVENPDNQLDGTVKAVAESAMREVVGKNQIEPILTANREPIQDEVRDLMQRMLDAYQAGVTVTRVQMQKADPPAQVIESYRDVQAARTDQDRMRNEAEAYANKVVPEARGQAARIIQQAEGYKQQVTAEAQGEAARFISIYDQYKKAPDVTRRRIYLDTMRDVLGDMNKVIVDNKGGSGVVPYLPLPELKQGTPVRPGAPVADATARGGRP